MSAIEPSVNSRTFHELKLQFLGLYRTKLIFQDFPGPGNFRKRNPGLSRRHGNPRSTFLVLVFPGCPGKQAAKWVSVWFRNFKIIITDDNSEQHTDQQGRVQSVPTYQWQQKVELRWRSDCVDDTHSLSASATSTALWYLWTIHREQSTQHRYVTATLSSTNYVSREA